MNRISILACVLALAAATAAPAEEAKKPRNAGDGEKPGKAARDDKAEKAGDRKSGV